MTNKNESKKVMQSFSKIIKIVNLLLSLGGHDLKLVEFHLSSNAREINNKVVCKYVLINGKWVLQCN